jgi:hypothetical protein
MMDARYEYERALFLPKKVPVSASGQSRGFESVNPNPCENESNKGYNGYTFEKKVLSLVRIHQVKFMNIIKIFL